MGGVSVPDGDDSHDLGGGGEGNGAGPPGDAVVQGEVFLFDPEDPGIHQAGDLVDRKGQAENDQQCQGNAPRRQGQQDQQGDGAGGQGQIDLLLGKPGVAQPPGQGLHQKGNGGNGRHNGGSGVFRKADILEIGNDKAGKAAIAGPEQAVHQHGLQGDLKNRILHKAAPFAYTATIKS